jgi:hypothetical protein
MKKLILYLMVLVVTAHAQTEDDYRRSLSHAEKRLNDIWNMRLTPTERNELRADERKWVVWKDKLPLEKEEAAVGARIDFLAEVYCATWTLMFRA